MCSWVGASEGRLGLRMTERGQVQMVRGGTYVESQVSETKLTRDRKHFRPSLPVLPMSLQETLALCTRVTPAAESPGGS